MLLKQDPSWAYRPHNKTGIAAVALKADPPEPTLMRLVTEV